MDMISPKLGHICTHMYAWSHTDQIFGSKGQGLIRWRNNRQWKPVEFYLV